MKHITTTSILLEKYCLNKANCIIITSILSILLISSACSHPRSVRPGNNFAGKSNISKEKPKKLSSKIETKEQSEEIPGQSEFEESLENNYKAALSNPPSDKSSDAEPFVSAPTKRLPTLKEQLNYIVEDQQTIIKDVNVLQSDVQIIKTNIEDIKSELLKLNGKKKDDAVKGTVKKSAPVVLDIDELPADNEPSAEPAGTILSDEDAIEKPSVTQKKSEAKVSSSISKKKQSSKKAPIQINKSVKNTTKPKNTDNEEIKTISLQKDTKIVKAVPNDPLEIITAKNSIIHKDYNAAIEQFSKIAKSEKNPVLVSDCHYYLGESHFGLHQYDKAILFYDKVVSSSVSNKRDEAQIKIAESNIRLGKADFAKKAYEDFVVKFPKSDLMPKARKMLQQL